MSFELLDCTDVLLREIEDKKLKRNDVAVTCALALMSSVKTDWTKVNQAIVERWSPYAREYILQKAWKIIDRHKENETLLKSKLEQHNAK